METDVRKKVLIIDDDAMILKVIRSYLKETYKVYCLRSGEEALKFFTKQIPDVVLLDYIMPGMDGPAVFRWMQKEESTKDVPVFFMTAVTDRERVLECMELNPREYLVKPVTSAKLRKKLAEFFENQNSAV